MADVTIADCADKWVLAQFEMGLRFGGLGLVDGNAFRPQFHKYIYPRPCRLIKHLIRLINRGIKSKFDEFI